MESGTQPKLFLMKVLGMVGISVKLLQEWTKSILIQFQEFLLDVELSRWGNPQNQIGQFVVQPFTNPKNITRFPVHLNGDHATHIIDWTPQRVYFQMLHGHYDYPPNQGFFIGDWTYLNKSIQQGNEKFIINLWQFNGHGPSNAQDVEVVIK